MIYKTDEGEFYFTRRWTSDEVYTNVSNEDEAYDIVQKLNQPKKEKKDGEDSD